MVDNARKTTSELERHVEGLTTQDISNCQSVTAEGVESYMEQLIAVKDVFGGQITGITHDINDNANALAVYFNL